MPALRRSTFQPRAGAAGTARLEFALTVIVLGVIGAFALDRIAQLKVLADQARVQTVAAQQRSQAALREASCTISARSIPSVTVAPRPPASAVPTPLSTPLLTPNLTPFSTAFTTHPLSPVPALSKGTLPGIDADPAPFPPCPGTSPYSPPFPPQLPLQGITS